MMRFLTLGKVVCIVALMLAVSNVSAKKVVIHCGGLIDGVSGKPSKEMSVIIENDRIVAVQADLHADWATATTSASTCAIR